MRFIWCVNELPNYSKGDAAGIDGYFLGMYDPTTTKAALQDIANHGKACGIYMASNWSAFVGKTGAQCANTISQRYGELEVPGLRVQVDFEEHDPDKIIACLEQLRFLRPQVGISWTMEGMQGGWAAQIAARVVHAKVRVVPQAYWGADGTIQGDWAQDMILRDLLHAGYPESLISLFYDARRLPRGWSGYAFTQARLP